MFIAHLGDKESIRYSMTDYTYTRTQTLLEAIKSKSGERLTAALLEEESTYSMHVFRYQNGKIVMDESKWYREEELLEEFVVGY